MTNLFAQLHDDEAGFLISSELVLVATICVLGLIVGLAEVRININNELEDVGSAFQSIQQSYGIEDIEGHRGWASGSNHYDYAEFCADQCDIQ